MKEILLVDDDVTVIEFLASFLKKRFKVAPLLAKDGESAIKLYKENRPDLVFLDINMPGLDGFAVLQELKSLNNTAKIVMLTAKGDEESVKQARGLGAYDYITKPLDLSELTEKVRRYIND